MIGDLNLIPQMQNNLRNNRSIKRTSSSPLEIELQSNGVYIQWRYIGFNKWNNLIAIKDLKGDRGERGLNGINGKDGNQGLPGINGTPGRDGLNGKDGLDGSKGNTGERGIPGKTGSPGQDGIDGKDGKNGIDGREIELRKSDTHVQWRYKGELLWKDLILISELKGPKGNPGKDGKDGINGKNGRDGYDGAPGRQGPPGYNGIDGKDGLTTSVNGVDHVDGNITLDTDDIPDTATNRYTNDTDISRLADTSGENTGDQDISGIGKIIHFGTVATAAATAAKEVTIADYTPAVGDILCLTYTLGSTVTAPTLSINGGAAINIQLNGIAANTIVHNIIAGAEVKYCYDGTYWQMFGSMRTSDSDNTQYVYWASTSTAGTAFGDYKLLMQTPDGKWHPLTLEEGVGTTKTISPQAFLLNSPILYYNTTTNVAQNGTFSNAYLQFTTVNVLRYTDNQATRTSQLPIYLKGTVTNGLFTLDNTDYTSFLTQTLPTTDDGFVYIRLGYMSTTANMILFCEHPIYQYKDGGLRQYMPDTNEYLKIDQTIPQTVLNGMPSFDGGLKVTGNVLSYYVNLSPVVYNATDYYLTGDAAALFYLSTTSDVQIINDDGEAKLPILIAGLSVTQPTIYMYLITAPALGNVHVTCFSDLNEADFLAFIKNITEDPSTVIDYHETAFTYLGGTYTNVTTKPVCANSGTTTWTNPSVITTEYSGFTVNPTTSNIDHVGNYTNDIATALFKYKGQLKVGNGNLRDLVTCPITSNPILDLSGGGGLQFAMTFVPEIISTGTVDTPISRSVYASGVYGTTAFEGGYATYSGTALGLWAAVQNAISGPTTLDEGVGIRSGMTYSSGNDSEMYVKKMICFQSDFTNLNNGSSKHDSIKHFEAKLLSDSVNSVTDNYGFYAADNSAKATNSWGAYMLEPSNYFRKIYIGSTPTKPTEDLEVQGNIKAGGYKSSDGTSGMTATKVFNDGAIVNTVTIKNGLITDWTQV